MSGNTNPNSQLPADRLVADFTSLSRRANTLVPSLLNTVRWNISQTTQADLLEKVEGYNVMVDSIIISTLQTNNVLDASMSGVIFDCTGANGGSIFQGYDVAMGDTSYRDFVKSGASGFTLLDRVGFWRIGDLSSVSSRQFASLLHVAHQKMMVSISATSGGFADLVDVSVYGWLVPIA